MRRILLILIACLVQSGLRASPTVTFQTRVDNLSGNWTDRYCNGGTYPAFADPVGIPYTFTFGGQSLSDGFGGCCGISYGMVSPYMTCTLEIDSTFSASMSLSEAGSSAMCSVPGLGFLGLPDCVSPKVAENSPGTSESVSWTVTLKYNGNASLVVDWDTSHRDINHYLIAAGEKCYGSIMNTEGSVEFSLDSNPGGQCSVEMLPDGTVVFTAGSTPGVAHVVAHLDNEDDQNNICLIKDYYFTIRGACVDCNGSICRQIKLGSVDVRFGLGPTPMSGGTGFLQIKSDAPSLALGTPQSLEYNFNKLGVSLITNVSGIRQLRSPTHLVDVLTNSPESYSINFFQTPGVLVFTNGLYVPTNSPYDVVTIELVGGDTNHVRITDSLTTTPADYYWQGNGWTLVTGGGIRKETKSSSNITDIRIDTRTISNLSNTIEYRSREKWLTNTTGAERMLESIVGSGDAARTNTYAYDEQGNLLQASYSDGSWEIFTYDSLARVTGHYRPFLNSAPTTNLSLCRAVLSSYDSLAGSGDLSTLRPRRARREIEYVLGREVKRTYRVEKPQEAEGPEERLINCVRPGAAWNDPDNLVTVKYIYTDAVHFDVPYYTRNPDNTTHSITFSQDYLPYHYLVLPVQYRDLGDDMVEKTWYDNMNRVGALAIIASGRTVSQEVYYYGSDGHLTNTLYLDGTSVRQIYDCCNLQSRVDRDGTVTSYTYDDLNRQLTSTANGITSSNVYNAVGNVIATLRFGTNGSVITNSSSTYDDGGQLTSSTDALGHTTSYTNYFDGAGQLIRITTYADATTRIETYARDGSLMKVGGTAVRGVRYEYGVETDGSYQRFYKKEIKLDADGEDTSEWTKAYTDMLGRNHKNVQPTAGGTASSQSYYNLLGQLYRQVDPDGVATVYKYNEQGRLEYTAVDFYADSQLHKDGTNRITRVASDVVSDPEFDYVRRVRTYGWGVDGVDSPNLLFSTETSLDGLNSRSITWNGSQGVTNRMEKVVNQSTGYTVVTDTAPDGSYQVTTNRYGRLISVTSRDASGAQIGGMTYGYDAHGRQNTITDARSGATTCTFNDADQVVSVTTPNPGAGAQVTTTYYDTLGRVTRTVLPDSTSVTNEYFATGELKKTYGSRTYPVEYTYDHAGRMKTMKTWKNFASETGAATTTWNYDSQRGLLAGKVYDGGVAGPTYAYTAAGRLKSRLWARGVMALYSYNKAGDLGLVNYSDATPDVTYGYDRQGRPSSILNGSNTCTLAYNGAGELLSESYAGGPLDGLVVTNAFDGFLRRTAVGAAGQPAVLAQFGYDNASRLKSVWNSSNGVTYTYLANSPLVSQITFTNNGVTRMTTTKDFDVLNRLTGISSTPSADAPISFDYANNSANQRTSITNADGSRWVYTYDSLGQVISGKKYWSDGTAVAGQQFEYAFDDIGNRTSAARGGDASGDNLRTAGYTNNLLNQLTSRGVPGYLDVLGAATNTATVTVNHQPSYRYSNYFRVELALDNADKALWLGLTNLGVLNNGTNADIIATNLGHAFVPEAPEAYGYDADGNLTGDGRWIYTWDAQNRLASMVSRSNAPAGSRLKLEFAYDYQGRRIQKVVSTHNGTSYVGQYTNRYVYDGWNLIAVLDGQSALVQSLQWGLDLSGSMQEGGGVGGLLAITDTTNGAHFVAFDGNGNVAALVRAGDGTTSANYEYGPFGEVLRGTGPMARSNPIRFSTKYQDEETDLLYYGYRYYTASTGRWLSRDPMEEREGGNLYSFVNNDSINQMDCLGLWIIFDKFGEKPTIDETYSLKEMFNFKKAPQTVNTVLGEVADSFEAAKIRVKTSQWNFVKSAGSREKPRDCCVQLELEMEGDPAVFVTGLKKLVTKLKVPGLNILRPLGGEAKLTSNIKVVDCKKYKAGDVEQNGNAVFNGWAGYGYDLTQRLRAGGVRVGVSLISTFTPYTIDSGAASAFGFSFNSTFKAGAEVYVRGGSIETPTLNFGFSGAIQLVPERKITFK